MVRYIDPLRTLQSTLPSAHFIKGDDVTDTSRQLYSFTPTSISKNTRNVLKPCFGFFLNDVATVDTPLVLPYRFETELVVKNREMADVYRTAWERQTTLWTQEAKARVLGNPRIQPGQVVTIDLNGPHTVQVKDISNDYNGQWLVLSVAHSITNNSFQTELSLARPDQVKAPANTHYRQYWGAAGKPTVKLESAGSTKRWVSSWETPVWNQVAA